MGWFEGHRIVNATCRSHTSTCYREVDAEDRTAYAVHRTEVGTTADQVAYAFEGGNEQAAAVTGGRMPYTHVIRKDGLIEQAIPWTAVGPHARAWNIRAASVALIGDFRLHRPTEAQWSSLVWLCSVAAMMVGGAQNIVAHDELLGGSSDPDKLCPGPLLPMSVLRESVTENLTRLCHDAGMVW